MRIRLWNLLLGICLMNVVGSAQGEGFGVGVIVGEPTGISFKAWQTPTTAIDAAVAWSFAGRDAFHLHADYLIHNYRIIKLRRGKIPLYFGLGARLRLKDASHTNNDINLGIRIPIGLAYLLPNSPLDLFLEVVPIMNLIPATELDLNAAFGVRFFFR